MRPKDRSYGCRVVNFTTENFCRVLNFMTENFTKSFSTVTEGNEKNLKSRHLHALQVCVDKGDLLGGRSVHSSILRNGMESLLLNNVLINMYVKCGSVEDASHLFNGMHDRDKLTWTHMITENVNNGSAEEALALFLRMKSEGVESNSGGALCSALKACAVLRTFEAGSLLHRHVIEMGLGINVFIGSGLVDMYVKCGSIEDAFSVFVHMHSKNVVTWSAMISGFVQHTQNEAAFELFREMHLEGVKPNEVTFMSILRGCSALAALDEGRHVHYLATESHFDEDIFVASTIIDMYAKCGSLADAHHVFCKMPVRNVVSYSALIAGYVQGGQPEDALKIFEHMRGENVKPDKVVFVSILNGLAKLVALEEGMKVHELIRKHGYESNKFVGSALVDMYAKCKSVKDARDVFNQLAERDVVSWTSLIEAYTECSCVNEALACFHEMEIEGVEPAPHTFVSILKACGGLGILAKGRQLHARIVQMEELDVFVASALIDMYVRCGSIGEGEKAFHKLLPKDNVVLWNAMIAGFVQHNFAAKAMILFRRMQIECVQPNTVTMVCILKACSSIMDGKLVHVYIKTIGLESELVLRNALIDMYAKCGRFLIARSLFHSLAYRNVISWNAIIAAHVQFEYFEDALKLFWRMAEECAFPDEHTFASIFKACSHLTVLWQGHKSHLLMLQSRCCCDVPLLNTLVEMHAKNGSIQAAWHVFDNMSDRSLISWNVMLIAYTQHGMAKETFELFQEMQEKGVEPNHITFVGVLSAYSHAGLVHEGEYQYVFMSQQYGITPTPEHLVCMVALLGRAGQIGKAEGLIQGTTLEPTILVWKTLCGAYTIHKDSAGTC